LFNFSPQQDQHATAMEDKEKTRRSLEAIALLSFGAFDFSCFGGKSASMASADDEKAARISSSEEEKPTAGESGQTPWKVALKPTGKGGDIRQGVSLAAPITFYPKDPSRLFHQEASNVQLKHAETLAKKEKCGTDLDLPLLKHAEPLPKKGKSGTDLDMPKLKSRSKPPVPRLLLPKNTSRSRSPVPKSTKKAPATIRSTTTAPAPTPPSSNKPPSKLDRQKSAANKQEKKESLASPVEQAEENKLNNFFGRRTSLSQQLKSDEQAKESKLDDFFGRRTSLSQQLKEQLKEFENSPPPSPRQQKSQPMEPPACASCPKLEITIQTIREEKNTLKASQQTLHARLQLAQQENVKLKSQMDLAKNAATDSVQEVQDKLVAALLENQAIKASAKQDLKALQQASNQELQDAKVELKKQVQEVASLKRESKKAAKECLEAKALVSQLQSEMNAARENNQHLQESLEVSRRECESLQSLLTKERAAAASVKQDFEQLSKGRQEAGDSMKELQSELNFNKQMLWDSQQRIKAIQTDRDIALDKLQKAQVQTQQDVQAVREESNLLLKESNAKVAELVENFKQSEDEKSALRADFLEQLKAKQNRIDELKQQHDNIESEKKTVVMELEEQVKECQSIRTKIEEAELEKGQAKDSLSKLKVEVHTTKQKLLQVQESLEVVKKERDEALSNLQKAEAKGLENMKSAMAEKTVALTEARAKIDSLERLVERVEDAKKVIEKDYAEKVAIQETAMTRLREESESLESELNLSREEKASVQIVVAEKEKVIEETKQRLDEAQQDLVAVVDENEEVMEKLNATVEKCKAAIAATEEMKVMLEEDGERIAKLQAAVSKLESERETLTAKLQSVSAERDQALAQHQRNPSFEFDPEELLKSMNMPENLDDDSMSMVASDDGEPFEIDPDALLRGMNMPENMDDSMAYLGDGWDQAKHKRSRRSSIMALEELEHDLKNLLHDSEEVLPLSSSHGTRRSAYQRAKSIKGGRQMSVIVAGIKRDSLEEEVLAGIRELE